MDEDQKENRGARQVIIRPAMIVGVILVIGGEGKIDE
jgi:hypothetical protein